MMASVILSDGWQGNFWKPPYIPTPLYRPNSKRWIIAKGNKINGIEAKR